MPRLIDADALIERLGLIGCYKHINPEAYDTLMKYEILEAIEDQPTAYDVEKVVSLLESKKNRRIAETFGRRNGKNLCAGYAQGHQDAIDIVKRGGVDG